MDYKNLIGFLITKELNQRQVRQAEMLIEYHFKIQYTKGIENTRADTLSRKAKLLEVILYKDEDGLIRYNYPKIAVTQEYKLLVSGMRQIAVT